MVDVDRVVADTRTLIRTQSVNPFEGVVEPGCREAEIAEVYASMLTDAGCEVHLDEAAPGRPNVIGSVRGSRPGPTLLLAGHLDTVGVNAYVDPFDARVEAGRIHGRGSCDMKGALATFVEVARQLTADSADFAGELLIGGVADEEDRMLGSHRWADAGPDADFAIVGEPTSLHVCPAHKGQFGMKIRTFGMAVHSSIRDQGVNAIEKMGAVIAAFDDYNDELAARPHHPLVGHGSFSFGVISGGDILSTVPDFCEVEADRRMIPGDTFETVAAECMARLDALAAADPAFRYEFEGPTLHGGILDTPIDHLLVHATADAVEAATGRPATVEAFPAATDAPHFGCPAVIMGPGSLAQAHGLDEYVEIDELAAATRSYLAAARLLLS